MTELMKAAHALDGIPVIALYSDGREEQTTVARAVGLGDLAKKARMEWAEVVEKLDRAFADAAWSGKVDNLTKQAAFDHLAAFNPCRNFDRMVKAYQRDWALNGRADRIVGLAKAQLIRRETAKIKKKTAKTLRKSAVRQAHIAEMRTQLAKTHADSAELAAQVERLTHDAQTRIDNMMKRLDAGQAQVRFSQERQAIADLARQDQIQADWAYKASLTSDQTLRQVYLNRAEGIYDDDD
jgi:hypothetical protein